MITIGRIGCGPWGMTLLKVWGETPRGPVGGVCRKHAERLPELSRRGGRPR